MTNSSFAGKALGDQKTVLQQGLDSASGLVLSSWTEELIYLSFF